MFGDGESVMNTKSSYITCITESDSWPVLREMNYDVTRRKQMNSLSESAILSMINYSNVSQTPQGDIAGGVVAS